MAARSSISGPCEDFLVPKDLSPVSMGSNSSIMRSNSASLMRNPIDDKNKFLVDEFAYSMISEDKMVFSKNWDWRPRGQENTLDLGRISMMDKISNLRWSSGSINETEIHIIFLPHLPVEGYLDDDVEIRLCFNGTDNEELKVMSIAKFPISLHTHIIFFPGHSFSLKRNGTFPWSLDFSTHADIKRNYIAADVLVTLKAYNSPFSLYSRKRGANIISLVPIEEAPTGIALSRPRKGQKWKTSKLKFGMNRKKEQELLELMYSSGADIEALQTMGKLPDAIEKVKKGLKDINLEDKNMVNMVISSTILGIFKTV
uniref:Protein 3 n=1 Tax=Linum virus 1 TaxID=2977971 RepID=A0A9N6YJ22_9RHAB|nr:TPA_asm: protein 3 [Linum virus 1]